MCCCCTQFLQLYLAYLYCLLSQGLSPNPTVCPPAFKFHTGCYATLEETYYIKRCLGEQVPSNELPDKELEVSDNCHLANGMRCYKRKIPISFFGKKQGETEADKTEKEQEQQKDAI